VNRSRKIVLLYLRWVKWTLSFGRLPAVFLLTFVPYSLIFSICVLFPQIDAIPMDLRFGIFLATSVPLAIVLFPATLIAYYLLAEILGMNRRVTEEKLREWFERYDVT
jgi:hypothetical protein